MAIAPLFLNGSFGGISDDKFAGSANSYQEIVGLNVRDNPKSVTVANAAVKDSGSVITDHVTCAVTVSSTGDILAFGDTGKIYRKAYGGSWVLAYAHSPSVKITDATEYNGHVYWATQTKLHRHAVSGISNSLSPDLNWGTFSVGSDYHPMCAFQGTLYVGDAWKIASVDGVTGAFSQAHVGTSLIAFTYDKKSTITHLTQNGAALRIYLKSARGTGYVTYTDTLSQDSDQVQPFQQSDLVVTKQVVDYVFSNGELFYYPYQSQSLKKIANYSLNRHAITLHKGRIYFGITGGIGCWGSLNKNYPESYTVEYKTSANDSISNVGCVFSDGNDLYFSWSTVVSGNTVYGIDKVSTSKGTGYFVTRGYYGNYMMQEKLNNQYHVAFKKLSAGDSIKIYGKYDGTGDFALQATLDSTKYKGNFAKIPVKGQFNYAEIKVELAGNAELYELLLDYGTKGI